MTGVVVPPVQRRGPRWLMPAMWVALSVALVVAIPALPWREAAAQLERVRIGWLAAAVIANFAILPLWAGEWRLLVPGTIRVTYTAMWEVVTVTASVLNSVPFFAGEASGVALLIGRAGLSRGAAVSVLAMDQLLVGIAKLAVIAAAAMIAPLPVWLRAGVLGLAFGVALLLVLLVPLAHEWERARDRLRAIPSAIAALGARLASLGAHLDVLRDRSRALRVFALALLKKAAELGGIIAVQLAFGLDASPAIGLLVLAALAITTLLPVSPANLGVYEATVFAAYRFAGVSADLALGIAIVQHLCFLLPALSAGYVTLTVRQLLRLRQPSEIRTGTRAP